MVEYLRCLMAHRDAARVVAGRAPSGSHRLRGAETMLAALLKAGAMQSRRPGSAMSECRSVYCCAEHHKTARWNWRSSRRGEREPDRRFDRGRRPGGRTVGCGGLRVSSLCPEDTPTFSSGPLDPCPRRQYGPHRARFPNNARWRRPEVNHGRALRSGSRARTRLTRHSRFPSSLAERLTRSRGMRECVSAPAVLAPRATPARPEASSPRRCQLAPIGRSGMPVRRSSPA